MSLELRNITKSYGEKVVVNDLSFGLDKPGVYALLGTNGAGKTTTLRILLGMLNADKGEIFWNNKPMNATEVNIGYLAEERGLYPKYELMDQLIYFAALKGMSKQRAKEQIKYWADKLHVEEYLYITDKKGTHSNKADQLSKGNQQKIQLMAALISDPDLVVLDEPLSGLDPVNSDLFKSVIREIINSGKYLILSSHQMEVIEEFCKDITILNRGIPVLQGDLNEIKKSYGRVNLNLKAEGDVLNLIKKNNINILKETPDGYNLRVTDENQAKALLSDMVTNNISIVKYELREPSLHEIFVEKVGGETNE